MQQVFISYSRRDYAFVNHLQTTLKSRGVSTWIDREGISAGSKWSETIQQALDHSDVMIVVISPESMASENVRDEWQYFHDHNKPIVPVLHRPAKIHFQLNRIQYIDFHQQPFSDAVVQLIDELEGLHITTTPAPSLAPSHVPYLRRRGGAFVALIALALALVVTAGLAMSSADESTPTVTPSPTDARAQLVLTATFPSVDYDPATSRNVRVGVPFANLRSGPGVNYDVVATAIEGEMLEAIGQVPGFNADRESIIWYFIEHPIGERVWIASDIVEIVPTSTATVRSIATQPASSGGDG